MFKFASIDVEDDLMGKTHIEVIQLTRNLENGKIYLSCDIALNGEPRKFDTPDGRFTFSIPKEKIGDGEFIVGAGMKALMDYLDAEENDR